MDEHEDTIVPQQRSVSERQLRRMSCRRPGAYDPTTRIDVIHAPGLDVLWAGPE